MMFLIILTGRQAGGCNPIPAPLTIQIVNDSGLSDTNIYIMVPGASGAAINPQGLFVDKNNGTATSVALSSLASNGSSPPFEVTSPISGNLNTVYSIQATNISSGAIYVMYNNSFVFSAGITPSPAPGGGGGVSGFRYDYAELSFSAGAVNDVDLTYVDKFGIPMQLEWFHGTNTAPTNLVAGSYVYASTKTLANLFAAGGFSNAVFSLTNAGATNGNITPGWQYVAGTNPYAGFARILAPQKIDAGSPFPSVTNILDSLAANRFTLNGYSVQGDYYYLGYQVKVARTNDPLTEIGEWLFTLAYNSDLLPSQYSLSAIGATKGQLPYTNTITFLVPNVTVVTVTNSGGTFYVTNDVDPNIYIYGAPTGTNDYLVNGAPPADTNAFPVEKWMIGDVLSAINFGFAGGIYGGNSAQWFSPGVAWPDPYGWAQPSPESNLTSGYYNAYAALIYYNADAYTFAYSERITPDVGMAVNAGDTIRITILPDDRLDSPVVSIPTNLITANSITLTWGPVPGAANYQVNVLRPLGIGPTNVSGTSCTLSGLNSGTPYLLSVQALGTASGNPVITPARPISATTAGTYAPITNGTVQVQVTFNATDPFYQLETVYINGIQLFRTNSYDPSPWEDAKGQNAAWPASIGTNQVVVTVAGNDHRVIFNDWLQFVLRPEFSFINEGTNGYGTHVTFITTNSAITDVVFGGQNRSQPGPTISGWPPAGGNVGFIFPPYDAPYDTNVFVTNYVGTATNFIVSLPGGAPTISLSYAPAETRKFAPPTTSSGPPAIFNVASSPGGGIRFDYDVPAAAPYVIEASADLLNWQTNFTGTGPTVGGTYTNAAGTNVMRFYRIKL